MAKSKQLFLILILLNFTVKVFSQSLTIQETITYLNKIFAQNSHNETIRPLKYRVTPIDANYYSIKNDEDRLENLRVALDSARHVYVGCYVKTILTISIDKEGFLKFQTNVTTTNCKDEKNNVTNELRESDKLNVDDIDLEKMIWYLYKNEKPWMVELNDTKDCGAVIIPCIDNDVKCIYCETKYGEYNWDDLQFKFSSKKADYTLYIYSDDAKYDTKRFYNALVYLIYSAKEQGYHRQRNDENDPFVSSSTGDNKTLNKTTNLKSEYRIPLKKEYGVFTLMINLGSNLNAKFILDSGAGESNISPELEKKLLASGIINERDYLPKGLYQLADGSIQECKRVKLPKLIVGTKTIYNVITSVGPPNSPNLLGQSFLGRTAKWAIDNSSNRLIIQ